MIKIWYTVKCGEVGDKYIASVTRNWKCDYHPSVKGEIIVWMDTFEKQEQARLEAAYQACMFTVQQQTRDKRGPEVQAQGRERELWI